jgi:hypothetical protein
MKNGFGSVSKPFFIHDFSRINVAGSTACGSKLCPKDRKPEKVFPENSGASSSIGTYDNSPVIHRWEWMHQNPEVP